MVKLATQPEWQGCEGGCNPVLCLAAQMRTKSAAQGGTAQSRSKAWDTCHFTFKCCVQNQGVWSLEGGGGGARHSLAEGCSTPLAVTTGVKVGVAR